MGWGSLLYLLNVRFASDEAEKIKEQIKMNRKFILVATNKAIDSKWCNWELGFGDAHKYLENIALIPLADNASTWNGTEYLKIYQIGRAHV